MEAEAAELDKTIAAPDPAAADAPRPKKMRGLYLKKRLILYGAAALVLLLMLALVAGVLWKLRAKQEPPAAEAEVTAVAKTGTTPGNMPDVRPPLPDIRPRLHLLPPEQVFHAPRSGEDPAKAEAQATESKEAAPPAPVAAARPAEAPEAQPALPAKPAEKPAVAGKPVEKAPDAPVSIFVTRKEKKAVGDCTVEAKQGADQKDLRTRGLADCIRLFNETDRAGK